MLDNEYQYVVFQTNKTTLFKEKYLNNCFLRNKERYCKNIRSANQCGRKYISEPHLFLHSTAIESTAKRPEE